MDLWDYRKMWKAFDKHGFVLSNFKCDMRISFEPSFELTLVPSDLSLEDDVVKKINELVEYLTRYLDLPKEIEEQIDAYQVMKKLKEGGK